MLKEGMFIQDRYEIISRIGSGGMADVYKAKDHTLNRFVAVKVLKPEFRKDRGFISKFRVEAQSAAGLAHPNIVNVYDVGEDNGISFIVMELVEGITLKEYIEKKGRLAVREATSIAIQVSMGLQAAHNNGIVHRDVKPQNIIISTDGKVKVTDFGIARVATSNTISSNVMGSVHYSSPEQARGGYSDYKSDIYSLGITMYEMLTGHVPFDGDTTVAIALKHLQEEMQSPRKYVPDLPKSTVQIIYKCTQKSPDRRYNDMEELIGDLKESLVNPEGDFVRIAPLDSHAHTVIVSKDELNKIKEGRAEVQPPEDTYQKNVEIANQIPTQQNMQGGRVPYQEKTYPPRTQNYGGRYYQNEDEDEEDAGINPKLEKFMTIGSIILGLLILFIFLALVGSATGLFDLGFLAGGNSKKQTETTLETTQDSGKIEVPNLLGRTEEEAKELLADSGLGIEYAGEEPSAEYDKGQIMLQQPAAGEMAEKNTTISYTVSSGSDKITVPDLADKTAEDAKAELEKAGLKCDQEEVYDTSVDTGKVSYTSPGAGQEVTQNSTVTIYISKGGNNSDSYGDSSDMVTVPDVTGQNSDAAQSMLENMGLAVKVKTTQDTGREDGEVLEQDVESGESVEKGTTINLTVNQLLASGGDSQTKETTKETKSSKKKYSTDVKLYAPQDYNGEKVRIELVQDGKTTTLVDGEAVEFPYRLKTTSNSDSSATAYVYVLDDNGDVSKKVEYDGVPFSK